MSVQPAVSIEEICRRAAITAEDVQRLRRLLYTDVVITEEEARALFTLDARCRTQDPSWRDFFTLAVTDHLINDVEPRGYLTHRNAEWLIAAIAPHGRVETKNGVELLINLLDKARWSPESLARFALEQILHAVKTGRGPLRPANEPPAGHISDSEVELVRRIIYAFGGDGNIAVTRAEAEVLFAIDTALVPGGGSAQWAELFVKAMANCLMAASGYAVPSREEALQREAWIESRGDITPASILGSFSIGRLIEIYREQSSEERALARLERQRIEIITNEEVTQGEVAWLADLLGRDNRMTANERLLLAFLERESPRIHPSLAPIVQKLMAEAA